MTLQPHCCHRKMPSVSSVNHSKSLSKVHDKLFDVSKSLSEIRDNLSDVSKSPSEVHDNLSDISKSLSEIRDNLSDVSKRLPQVSEDQFCTQNTHCKLAGADSSHRTPCRKSVSPHPRPGKAPSEHSDRAPPTQGDPLRAFGQGNPDPGRPIPSIRTRQPRPRETHSEHSDRATPTRRTGN